MTVLISIGRRVPKSWFSRQANRVKGVISMQEHLWLMLKQSLQLAKKKANMDGRLTFVMKQIEENEDLHYKIQWLKITIQGTKAQEQEEYDEAQGMYSSLGNILKKELPKDGHLSKVFKTKILSSDKVKDAYKKGYGSVKESNLSAKLLEMGILTHIEKIDDYNSRD